MRKMLYGVVAMMLVVGMAVEVQASQRNFVWTIEYPTLGKGNAELEFYQTAVTKDIQTRNASDWTQQVELEYGVTDRFNVALYQFYEQAADSSSLVYGGYKVELKYQIANKNDLPVDVLLYGEQEVSTEEGQVFEGKLILAKEVGRVSVAYNQIYERKLNADVEKGEHEYAAGISFEIVPWFRLGVESKGSYTEREYAAGPTIAWMGNRVWANLGAVYGLNHKTNDREVRFLLGVPF